MLITLTNANPAHKNKPVILNSVFICSIHRNVITREDTTIDEVTFVHCPPHGTWEVQELPEDIMNLINPQSPKILTEKTEKSKKSKTKLL